MDLAAQPVDLRLEHAAPQSLDELLRALDPLAQRGAYRFANFDLDLGQPLRSLSQVRTRDEAQVRAQVVRALDRLAVGLAAGDGGGEPFHHRWVADSEPETPEQHACGVFRLARSELLEERDDQVALLLLRPLPFRSRDRVERLIDLRYRLVGTAPFGEQLFGDVAEISGV